jgi:hypothetical protein
MTSDLGSFDILIGFLQSAANVNDLTKNEFANSIDDVWRHWHLRKKLIVKKCIRPPRSGFISLRRLTSIVRFKYIFVREKFTSIQITIFCILPNLEMRIFLDHAQSRFDFIINGFDSSIFNGPNEEKLLFLFFGCTTRWIS